MKLNFMTHLGEIKQQVAFTNERKLCVMITRIYVAKRFYDVIRENYVTNRFYDVIYISL